MFVFILVLWGCSTIENKPLQLKSGSAPIYPEELKNSGIEGYVVLKYDVSTEGMVTNIRIVESDPARVFDYIFDVLIGRLAKSCGKPY